MLLADADGTECHSDLSWSVSSSVCHVADNLRIWAERLAGFGAGEMGVAPYDERLLAAARRYADIPLAAALWSLERARGDWHAAVARAPHEGLVVIHSECGEMRLEDIARGIAHDSFHHAWDIRRTLEAAR
jgi:hypothetical protein